jgi:hypothetical protein
MNGINIYTKSEDWLGRALTNPSYAKNNISEFDINVKLNDLIRIHPKDYVLPEIKLFSWAKKRYGVNATAQNAWGTSVEAWYFANSNKNMVSKQKQTVMFHLMVCKFTTYPNLIVEIDKRGGLEFLKLCSHVVSGNKNWEGVGEKSNFIKVLVSAYKYNKGMIEIEQKELF